MPVSSVGTSISLEISPFDTAIVSDRENSSEMPVTSVVTGISQGISQRINFHFTVLGKLLVKCQFLHRQLAYHKKFPLFTFKKRVRSLWGEISCEIPVPT